MKLPCGVAFAAVVLAYAPVAHAYELLGATWPSAFYPNGVPYCPVINAKDATSATLKAQFGAAVDASARAWSDQQTLCSALQVRNATGDSLCNGSPSYSSDTPWVYWETNWGAVPGVGPSTIGVTPYWSSSSQITSAKILFNDRDFTWTVSTQNPSTDVQSIATHEFGHFFGMDHYDANSTQKRYECNGAVYPAVMCSFYPGGIVRTLTSDDVQGICYLYPKAGAIGSSCDGGCGTGLQCHPTDGYCTKSCGTCPTGYSCNTSLAVCERDVPPPNCPSCGSLPCGEGSMCIGASGSSFCTDPCSASSPCPFGFDCTPLDGGGSICWPQSNSCASSPVAGEPCGPNYACGLGNICLQDDTQGGTCYKLCTGDGDCSNGDTCQDLGSGVKYCGADTTCPTCGSLPCDASSYCVSLGSSALCTPACTTNSQCPVGFTCIGLSSGGSACYPLAESCSATDPGPGQACGAGGVCKLGSVCKSGTCYLACRVNGDCPNGKSCYPIAGEANTGYCDTTGDGPCSCDKTAGSCDAGCTCDPSCTGVCTCDVTSGSCDAGCACDASCPSNQLCLCDSTTSCDADCACDPECRCDCDVTTACDAGCESCDPECKGGGCFNAAVRPQADGSSLVSLALGLAALAAMILRARRAQATSQK